MIRFMGSLSGLVLAGAAVGGVVTPLAQLRTSERVSVGAALGTDASAHPVTRVGGAVDAASSAAGTGVTAAGKVDATTSVLLSGEMLLQPADVVGRIAATAAVGASLTGAGSVSLGSPEPMITVATAADAELAGGISGTTGLQH